jgi:hypothetical protein
VDLSDFSDEPLNDQPTLTPLVKEYLDWVNTLREDDQYSYAFVTLEGIARTIQGTGRITDGQRQAVRNIIDGAERANDRHFAPKASRRYEGWERKG